MSGEAALSLSLEGFFFKENIILKWSLSKRLSEDQFMGNVSRQGPT